MAKKPNFFQRIKSSLEKVIKAITQPQKEVSKPTQISPTELKPTTETKAKAEKEILSQPKPPKSKSREQRIYSDYSDPRLQEGEMAYQRVIELIASSTRGGSYALGNFLDREVNQYGEVNVKRGLGSSPEEAIQRAEICVESSDRETIASSISRIASLIKGAMLDEEEAQDIGEAMDEDDYELYEGEAEDYSNDWKW